MLPEFTSNIKMTDYSFKFYFHVLFKTMFYILFIIKLNWTVFKGLVQSRITISR